ncbi:glutathione S-transferase family protein [Rhodanobacter sp. 7MK24]|uniref:glutathione S-transferase family protein n=1 Tax=Rhodanobacter sp. 7MK24 TaxID=2775922 RepID=UPI0017825CD3|nr:glutathione S-transferase family protein [Rhodanobacter sp. 7MK24]MBD8879434.1 glutathione S-transferase family protein [Rhodanobacter sp. 7MK24]
MSTSQITLYGCAPAFGLPDPSPFVTKTEVQLQMAGLPYRKVFAIPPEAPKGKLPYIDDAGEIVCDSSFIRAHLERKYALDLDAGLDARQRAEAWAVERLLEDHLYWAMVWFRWVDAENFAKGPAHFVDRAPEEMRQQLRDNLQAAKQNELHAHGLGRHSREQIAELGTRSIDALAVLLGEHDYLFGDRPHAVDAIGFAVLAAILTPFFDTPLRAAAERHPNLVAYVARMMRFYYPAHAWQQALAA